MKQPCGCCAGIELVTPEPEANRPGLPGIAYRVGTHATFLETMLARLSTLYLKVPAPGGSGTLQRIYPLRQLTTRDPSDPSIALLDAWAMLGDVLSFYQERIANEGYLRTATERRSIMELARLIGYRLRPGVSASVYLAFTVSDGFYGEVPVGTRAQSIPGTGERPQFFETYEKLTARDTWNNLKPRVTRPQVITAPGTNPDGSPSATGADFIDTIYFAGISTNLNPGDSLLIIVGNGPGQQVQRIVQSVDVQAADQRTEAVLYLSPPSPGTTAATGLAGIVTALQAFIDQAASRFSGSDLADQVVAEILQPLLDKINPPAATPSGLAGPPPPPNLTDALNLLGGAIPQLQDKHDVAVKRKFTRLEPWIAEVLRVLTTLIDELSGSGGSRGQGSVATTLPALAASPLENLTKILVPLALAPSLQPANSLRLPRTVNQAFSRQSDIAPRLLAKFYPAAADTLYKAWGAVQAPSSQVQVSAFRTKAALFPGTYPGASQSTQSGDNTITTTTTFTPPSITNAWGGLTDGSRAVPIPTIALDAAYDKIQIGSWLAIDRPVLDPNGGMLGRTTTYHQVVGTQTLSMATTLSAAAAAAAAAASTPTSPAGYTARITQVTLSPSWLQDLVGQGQSSHIPGLLGFADFLHGTVVYGQSEGLDLAEEPLDTDVEGDTIELASLYEGLESGRWIIVSGDRTDIPNVSGVKASELVMVSGVTQGSSSAQCVAFPPGVVPFSQYYYTTEANAVGDRLVVGLLGVSLDLIPLPSAENQQYCDQVQIAPDIYASAYVPTPAERGGDFSDFGGLLIDPNTKLPVPGGILKPVGPGQIFAWRITTQPVHTALTLAHELAYTYDSATVTIYGNVVKATHGQTTGEVLGNGDASQSLQEFALHQSPLTYLPAPTPAGAKSTLVLRVNEVEWHEADNLVALGPRDREYITETDDNDKTSAIFGTGEHGVRLPSGTANVKAVYRSGIGKPGNVQAEQISQLATQPLGVKKVINPLAASGGADRDTADQARQNAPLVVMALDRLVSVRDYADFARNFAGIGKASAARLPNGRELVVHVTIAGADDIPIDLNSDLYNNLLQALLQSGDPHQPIQVVLRRLKLLVISLGVKLMADYTWESVAPNVRAALLDAYSFDRRDLGQSAFLSEATAVVQGVQGVEYADMRVFDSVAEKVTAAQLSALSTTLKLNDAVEAELAHVDKTATEASKRILPAELVILTPDIPDTLILTEITS
jgi:hypothetical protein